MVIGRVLFVMVMLEMISNGNANQSKLYKVFDVTKYGAIPNSRTANTQAFARAWSDACKWNGKSRVLVPAGEFMLGSIKFIGPCKNPIAFILKGTLKAPSNPSVMKKDHWISFRYVTGLVVNGGGTFDGNGVSSWKSVTPNSNPLPITPSHVQIKDITYKNIWGTSSTKLAVGLQCSKRFPCKNIVLNNINLVHLGPEGFARSLCSNVNGASYGRQTPASCI
ncbi:hypothetical protein LWI29_027986 [Acer saccharum]|uniref:Polygalacturonase n=1 Tax=Acer saccharum TaxID=4024 RepID=A0AA39TIL4_ACESA|nr:hypothetical protein LWI29_027986 [Acer saccharum]